MCRGQRYTSVFTGHRCIELRDEVTGRRIRGGRRHGGSLLAAAAVAATPKDGSSTNALFFKLHDHCMNAMDLHRLLVLAMARPLMLHDGAATGKKCNLLWSAPGAAAPPLQQGETGKRK
ncbi:Os07g0204650 [Oryza sativa Japonica Group]|uniref:Os07g0204650 protein n=1 Tax=Oryza sativa subsp. japonica TaxID=39947 RepID=A0A0P0X3F3_ORYSJ|nr:Os07g0204650 [Oryza sativa Japonica Group]